MQMVKCSTRGNCSHNWKLSSSKALFADSKQFSTVSLYLAMCLRDSKGKARALGDRCFNYFISLLPRLTVSHPFLIEWSLIRC